MKKNVRIFAVILSCILLVGAIGFAISAENEPSVEIYKKIISYEGAIRIAYAVDAEGLADGQEIKIAFTFDENKNAPTGKLDASKFAYVNGVTETYTPYDYAHLDGTKIIAANSGGSTGSNNLVTTSTYWY